MSHPMFLTVLKLLLILLMNFSVSSSNPVEKEVKGTVDGPITLQLTVNETIPESEDNKTAVQPNAPAESQDNATTRLPNIPAESQDNKTTAQPNAPPESQVNETTVQPGVPPESQGNETTIRTPDVPLKFQGNETIVRPDVPPESQVNDTTVRQDVSPESLDNKTAVRQDAPPESQDNKTAAQLDVPPKSQGNEATVLPNVPPPLDKTRLCSAGSQNGSVFACDEQGMALFACLRIRSGRIGRCDMHTYNETLSPICLKAVGGTQQLLPCDLPGVNVCFLDSERLVLCRNKTDSVCLEEDDTLSNCSRSLIKRSVSTESYRVRNDSYYAACQNCKVTVMMFVDEEITNEPPKVDIVVIPLAEGESIDYTDSP